MPLRKIPAHGTQKGHGLSTSGKWGVNSEITQNTTFSRRIRAIERSNVYAIGW